MDNKRDELGLPIVILPSLSSNVPAPNTYLVFVYVSLCKKKIVWIYQWRNKK